MIIVGKLKAVLENALTQLDDYDDKDVVKTVPNTYFLHDCRYFLGASSEGYVNLDEIEITDEDEE